ncbi:hypothetical protein ACN38_g12048 [Penicillium nordicum]|uniref:Uncharacterized protein n=1 Tax=Penicillium nordicum TaxID=229535 RepID=A0A0M8NZ75_9EURO|nr:hypothetical protein ACN38_g12048 [Penicillium nordicum]
MTKKSGILMKFLVKLNSYIFLTGPSLSLGLKRLKKSWSKNSLAVDSMRQVDIKTTVAIVIIGWDSMPILLNDEQMSVAKMHTKTYSGQGSNPLLY